MRFIIVGLVSLVGLAGNAAAFDCDNPGNGAVAVVCSDPELIKLTNQRQQVWKALYDRVRGDERKTLVNEERHWLAHYSEACGVRGDDPPATISDTMRACFKRADRERIAYMRAYIAGGAEPPAATAAVPTPAAKPAAAARPPEPPAPAAKPAAAETPAPPAPAAKPAAAETPAPPAPATKPAAAAEPPAAPAPKPAAAAEPPPPQPKPSAADETPHPTASASPPPTPAPAPTAVQQAALPAALSARPVTRAAASSGTYHVKFTFACQTTQKLSQVLGALERNDIGFALAQTDCLPLPAGREANLLSVTGSVAKIRLCSEDAGCTDVYAEADKIVDPTGRPLGR